MIKCDSCGLLRDTFKLEFVTTLYANTYPNSPFHIFFL